MPDLYAVAVAGWLAARGPDVAALPSRGAVDADEPSLRATLRLGVLLDQGAAADPARLAARLVDPATAVNLRAVLTQLGAGRRVVVLDWLASGAVPQRDAVLAAAMAPGQHGDFVRAELQALHRAALLARIFAPDRIAALLAACRPADLTGRGA